MNAKKLAWLRNRANELRRKIESGELTGEAKDRAVDEYVKIFYEAWL